MRDLSQFIGPNAGYVLELYERYRADPASVSETDRALFAQWTPSETERAASTPALFANADASPLAPAATDRIIAAARLARYIRERGHLAARIDPLGSPPPGDPKLELCAHGIETGDLAAMPASVVGGPCAEGAKNALEALGKLRQLYSGSIGYEPRRIRNSSELDWLYDAIESRRYFQDFGPESQRAVLQSLTETDSFEQFLHKTFISAKRFSIEGADMMIPMLDEIIRKSAFAGVKEIVLGMAHRGRLNVLAHILGKPYAAILAEFQEDKSGPSPASLDGAGWTGDVKYHLGARREYAAGPVVVPITLVPNPSHLEFANPVAEGHVRAAQDQRSWPGIPVADESAALAVLIHGDAAFPGQGIVAETLNLCRLNGYHTGGTIHIIANNQIGFTTLPEDSRSTLYASDLAKGFEIPIVHVNADDPEACIAAVRLACAYREQFRKDFLIDLVGYRRWGHNEGDVASFTQPQMVAIIEKHPRVRELWAKELERRQVVTRDEAETMVRSAMETLQTAKDAPALVVSEEKKPARSGRVRSAKTAVPADRLIAFNEALLSRPEGFAPDPKLDEVLQRRRAALNEPNRIEWAHAESLAFASILADGVPIRLSGQDSQRGTFGQRNLVLHDIATGERYTPLEALPAAKASFGVYNSPLSENAVLGFEYGYSIQAPGVLVLWEAQFGDFANGAQVIIDQFVVSGKAKWRQEPSLVLLLPHGYEGQGPEHSSARLERFLQLCAGDNLRVVNCTTSAQYFHVLRRQAALLETDPRPLIVMTPKSLLRLNRAKSSLSDLTEGTFQPVLNDADALGRAESVTRLILCSGKVYMDLIGSKTYEESEKERVAVVRIEELYPFPDAELRGVLAGYPNLEEVVWLQEEPANMGAATFVAPRLTDASMVGWKGELIYAGRPESASPAEGSHRRHDEQQSRLITTALRGAPAPPQRSKVRA